MFRNSSHVKHLAHNLEDEHAKGDFNRRNGVDGEVVGASRSFTYLRLALAEHLGKIFLTKFGARY